MTPCAGLVQLGIGRPLVWPLAQVSPWSALGREWMCMLSVGMGSDLPPWTRVWCCTVMYLQYTVFTVYCTYSILYIQY